MTAISFNPLATARDLEAAGIERRQAEAIAEGMREAADAAAGADRADLATKGDIEALRRETKAALAELRAATRADIDTLRSELRRMLGFLAALILAMAAKLFGIV